MSFNSTLYFTAVEEMFQDMLQLEEAESENHSKNELESYNLTPKRTVRIRQQNLFGRDSSDFVIYRRSPKRLLNGLPAHNPGQSLETCKDLQGLELLRLRKERSENEQKQKLQRHLNIRI
ncbi:uncharacterized protein Dwil_GK18950 [Drosophila willistoni]|uniref:Uncharacterized protein n=1 Tax=Drosophila willistoni TaxID=7260 RepID=B4NJL3_DROWI|nr:uncharacterized protein LOC6651571 [Drosophila willistoni]EDW83937.1 uncharacterized protein Dwil_GK18950 [Drosophila willistoni]